MLTSVRAVEVVTGPAATGKTRVLAAAAGEWSGPVFGTATSQNATNELRAAGVQVSANTTRLLADLGRIPPGSLIAVDEGSMISITRLAAIVDHAARNGCKLVLAGDQEQLAVIHVAAINWIRHSEGRAYYEKKLAEGKRTKRRSRSLERKMSDAIVACLQADARQATAARAKGPGGPRGTTLHPARPAHTPHASSSDKPRPDPASAYDPAPLQAHRRSRPRRKPRQPLDTNCKEDPICY